jgi:hypothetical protein
MRSSNVLLAILFSISFSAARAQVVGGENAFQYLNLSNSPHSTALGGICVANTDDDISFALQNPALMRPVMHNELQLVYNNYYADVKVLNMQYGFHVPDINTSFALGIQYLNYGSFTQTDDVGNVLGTFQARDLAVSLGASRSYLNNWRYGADVKFAYSTLGSALAGAMLMDVGLNYLDTSSLWDFGVCARNMGVMLSKYSANREPMPFDLQLGAVKQFAHIPLRLIITLHHLYEWDVAYNNPADVSTNSLSSNKDTVAPAASFWDKLGRHFTFAAELSLAKRLTITASYNVMRRQEMKLADYPASAGFAFGLGLHLNKFDVHYARSYYSIVGPYNELSLTMHLNKLMNVGKEGGKLHWNSEYKDWL